MPQLQEAAQATDVALRGKAAIVGALIADAATAPLHWIYDCPKISMLLADKGKGQNPEFYDPPSCPFYTVQWGGPSAYGDEAYVLLQSVAAVGALDPEHYAQTLAEFYQSNPDKYRNRSIKNFMANYEAGKRYPECGCSDDFQANCFSKIVVVVARYAGDPVLLKKAEEAIRVQQNNDNAVKYGLPAARILERVILGDSIDSAIQWALEQPDVDEEIASLLQRALATRTTPLTELTYEPAPYMAEMVGKHMALKGDLDPFSFAVWCNGPACGNPAAFANVFMALVNYGDYVTALRANMVAGGDNSARSCLIGAVLAASGGLNSIPEGWMSSTTAFKDVESLAEKVVAAR